MRKAKALLLDEIARWHSLPDAKRRLFASLLKDRKEFEGFLSMVGAVYANKGISELISNLYVNKICQHAELDMLIKQYPCELAYALALIDTIDHHSITRMGTLQLSQSGICYKTSTTQQMQRRLCLLQHPTGCTT